jgi:hypothetical protein
MAMHTETLTSTWYQLADLDDESFVMAVTVGDDCDVVLDVATPDASATAFTISEGINRLDIPEGKSLYIRCPSGTCDLTYSKYSGIIMDRTKCAYAYSDAISVDVVEAGNTDIKMGVDDTPADALTYVGFLQTVAAGIAGAATIDVATLRVQLFDFRPGQVLRIYGVAESTSQFATLTAYADLASGLTLTTEYVDITIGHSGTQSVDITDLLQELVNVSGWSGTSPIQFWVGETTGTVTGQDDTLSIYTGWKLTAVFATV